MWKQEIADSDNPDLPIMLVGMKSDNSNMDEDDVIEFAEAEFGDGAKYYASCSAKKCEGITEVFNNVGKFHLENCAK